jgi:hypothetical protein
MKKRLDLKLAICAVLAIFLIHPSSGQDLDSLLGASIEVPVVNVGVAFKGTRVGNGQSASLPGNGELRLTIGHRFGKISGGLYEFFGLDQATMRLGFDYGFNDWLAAGFGRSTLEKTWDLNAKSRLFQQKPGGSPVNFTLYVSGSVNTLKNIYPPGSDAFGDRLSASVQGLISRKFKNYSLQLAPVYMHTSYDPRTTGSVDIMAVGGAASLRLTRFIGLTAEYYVRILKPSFNTSDPLTLGIEIETGGHLFQLVMTNAQAMYEKGLLSNTTSKWSDGDIYFGFNLIRTFYLKK